jgi:hypothetical protein
MKKNKVTSEALRRMAMGETKPFALPEREPATSRAVNSGKTIAYRLQRELGCKFSACTDYDNKTLTITKTPRT